MSGFRAQFQLGGKITGYLALAQEDGETKKQRVPSWNDATVFMDSNEALISASTELEPGESVIPANNPPQPSVRRL